MNKYVGGFWCERTFSLEQALLWVRRGDLKLKRHNAEFVSYRYAFLKFNSYYIIIKYSFKKHKT